MQEKSDTATTKKFESKKSNSHVSGDIKTKMGRKYEEQICEYYENQGYKIYPNGKINGRKDGGIDIVAYKGSEAVLIQCKNWENTQVKQKDVRVFYGDCELYVKKNQKYLANKRIRRVFVTSCQNIGYDVQKYIEDNDLVEYKIIPYEK